LAGRDKKAAWLSRTNLNMEARPRNLRSNRPELGHLERAERRRRAFAVWPIRPSQCRGAGRGNWAFFGNGRPAGRASAAGGSSLGSLRRRRPFSRRSTIELRGAGLQDPFVQNRPASRTSRSPQAQPSAERNSRCWWNTRGIFQYFQSSHWGLAHPPAVNVTWQLKSSESFFKRELADDLFNPASAALHAVLYAQIPAASATRPGLCIAARSSRGEIPG